MSGLGLEGRVRGPVVAARGGRYHRVGVMSPGGSGERDGATGGTG
jgi:hypothetical protein